MRTAKNESTEWGTKRKRSQELPGRRLRGRSFLNAREWATSALQVKASTATRVQEKSLNADAEVTTEKILEVDSAAPGMVATKVSVKGSVNSVALCRALYDISQAGIRSELGAGHGVGSPKANVPFVIGIPLRTGCRRNLFHFFSRVSGAGKGKSTTSGEDT